MTQEETRLKEIEKEIETLKKERTALKNKQYEKRLDSHLAWMLSKVEMKVAFGNVLLIYCTDDEGLKNYEGDGSRESVRNFMDELVKKIVEKLGNPIYCDLKDNRDSDWSRSYYRNPYFRVLLFNVSFDDDWNDTLEDVINKIKIEKNDD